jgi:hypothetical protein
MIRTAVRRAAIWTAGAGLLVAPMSIASPQIALMACDDGYEDTIPTTTEVWVGDSIGRYGNRNRVYVDVDGTDGEPVPPGTVEIYIDGDYYTTLDNNQDVVSTNLRRTLKARNTYAITAEYISECPYEDSSGNTAYYSVRRANVNADARVLNARQAKFRGLFDGSEGLHPQGGDSNFTVTRGNKKKPIRRGNKVVRDGMANKNLKNLGKGRYKLTVKFNGTRNFKPASDTTTFRRR